jgi:hypothetical protein
VKDYYELLELAAGASSDDIKRAFRRQIAKYHPDKVQHLGQEFQEIAAVRAAELTEAYRILSSGTLRAEYDARRSSAPGGAASTSASAAAPVAPATEPPRTAGDAPPQPEPPPSGKAAFVQERATRDAFVRNAIVERFRQALAQVAGSSYDEAPARGFDIAWSPKPRLFGRAKGPKLLGRYVARVDGESVADAWTRAGKLNLGAGEDVCVILMGIHVAPPKELAVAIAEQRRKPARGVNVTLIPVNASVWHAHMPVDAPDVAKNLLDRLRAGT